ncbi:Endonuclease/Exonuclease/phosphatase family protein [Falsiruegeria litorea R37]|uniref:Endonuclease/Exonuclease/phosphatase family protein n=1 Tax=Falsiruegeria litorea R37 TaxID=1200284 RepID=A0A1Y5S7N6_9RHOB|nr:endonuclease/exonuclease/phosphatase family protein [Falsiruegeria litorea]SLN32024.1 Endonuclease/Exonuclease/phosphatase family protein [Falsiruegeria litorea R37]
MRVATYNVEWFANLFDKEDQLIADDSWSGRHGVTRARQIEALAKVFTAIDADIIMIVEAPNTGKRQSTVRALDHFVQAFGLRTSKALMGFANDTHQEIAVLYDPDRLTVHHDPKGDETGKKGSAEAPRFDGTFRIDLDVDATEDLVRFSKPPLELAVETAAGSQFRMIGVHLKSKAPHGARTRDEVIRRSIANRRKQLAQAIWLRQRVEAHQARGEEVILLGDLNDGPGLDEFENLFGRSSVEILLDAGLYDPHPYATEQGQKQVTARFENPETGSTLEALLDYILVTSTIQNRHPEWKIWHPDRCPDCQAAPELQAALRLASDHFPVTLDVDL